MLTFYHGLRVSELCNLRRQDVDLHHGRIWIARLKGQTASEHPLHQWGMKPTLSGGAKPLEEPHILPS